MVIKKYLKKLESLDVLTVAVYLKLTKMNTNLIIQRINFGSCFTIAVARNVVAQQENHLNEKGILRSMRQVYVPYRFDKHKPISQMDAKSIKMWSQVSNKPILVEELSGKVYQDGMQNAEIELGFHKTWQGWERD